MLKRIGNYQYSTGDLLGHGSYGFVYRGINTKTNEPVAVKAIDLTKLRPVDKYYLEKEVELQSKIDSPHVVKLYERFVRSFTHSLLLPSFKSTTDTI